MRLKILLFAVVLISSIFYVHAQNSNKVYAYARQVAGGAMQSSDNTSNASARPNFQYFIYLETKASSQPTITSVYLHGAPYRVSLQKSKSPVALETMSITSDKTEKLILVPKTKSYVYQLVPTFDNSALQPSSSVKTSIASNEVFIKGIAAGKYFTITQKKLKLLPTLFAE
jgi:uncharacterized protein (UPF0333 family)